MAGAAPLEVGGGGRDGGGAGSMRGGRVKVRQELQGDVVRTLNRVAAMLIQKIHTRSQYQRYCFPWRHLRNKRLFLTGDTGNSSNGGGALVHLGIYEQGQRVEGLDYIRRSRNKKVSNPGSFEM